MQWWVAVVAGGMDVSTGKATDRVPNAFGDGNGPGGRDAVGAGPHGAMAVVTKHTHSAL